MSNLHQEHHFEAEICKSLAANGWLYAEGDAAHYDRSNALFLPDLLTWIETTQPDTWQRLTKTHGPALNERLAERVRKSLNERGTLDVLRRGVEMLGLKEPLSLVHPAAIRRQPAAGGAPSTAFAEPPAGRTGPSPVR
jgi:type I restriction enzyme R subunit